MVKRIYKKNMRDSHAGQKDFNVKAIRHFYVKPALLITLENDFYQTTQYSLRFVKIQTIRLINL